MLLVEDIENLGKVMDINALKLFNEGKYEEAIEEFKNLIEEDPKDYSLYNNIGTAYFKMGEYIKAIENYTMAMELNSKGIDIYQNLAETYKANGQMFEAINVLQFAASLYPENVDLRYHLSRLFKEDSQYDLALGELEFVLDTEPGHMDAQYDIANVFFEMGLYDNAISHYKEVLEEVESADIHFNIARAYEASDDLDKAILHFIQTIIINPAYYPAYKKLGVLFMAKSEFDEAVEYLEKYLKCDLPQDEKDQVDSVIKRLKTSIS